MADVKWSITAKEFVNCNCSYGCPCQFNGRPSYGNCEVVAAMQINEYPEPEVKLLGPDDAPSILLDPTRTFADFGSMTFTPLLEIARRAVAHWREHGVEGGYTHLKLGKTES